MAFAQVSPLASGKDRCMPLVDSVIARPATHVENGEDNSNISGIRDPMSTEVQKAALVTVIPLMSYEGQCRAPIYPVIALPAKHVGNQDSIGPTAKQWRSTTKVLSTCSNHARK